MVSRTGAALWPHQRSGAGILRLLRSTLMLKQRVITAIVLLVILGAVMLAPVQWPLLAIFGLLSTLACWQWQRLGGRADQQRRASPIALLTGALIAWLSVYCYDGRPQGQAASLGYRGLVPVMVAYWLVG